MAQGGAAPLDTGVTDNGTPGTGGNISPPAGTPAAPRGGKDGVGGARARALAAVAANPNMAPASGADDAPATPPAAAPAPAAPPADPDKTPPATPKGKEGEIAGDPDLVARMARLSAENRELRKKAEAAPPDLAARAERMGKIEAMIKAGDRIGALRELQVSYQDVTADYLASDPDSPEARTAKVDEGKLDELGKKIDALADERKAEKEAEAKAAADARAARIRTGLHEVVTKDAGRFHYVSKPSQFDRALDSAVAHAKAKGGEMREALGRPLTDEEATDLVLKGFDLEEKKLRSDFGDPPSAGAQPAAGIDAGVSAGIQRQEAEIKHTDARSAKKRAVDAILRSAGH